MELELTLRFSSMMVEKNWSNRKVGCIFPMVITPEFHMGQYRDDDHREDAPHFI